MRSRRRRGSWPAASTITSSPRKRSRSSWSRRTTPISSGWCGSSARSPWTRCPLCGTAIFTESGDAARRFQRGVHVGMIGVNVPIRTQMAYYSSGGWKDSLFGDHHIHGADGIRFCTRAKAVTQRWRGTTRHAASYSFPTSS
ncbi:MAG: aldehyde dehydrogenase family protein [Streptosporangiaceae bacterium]